jgi:hypothetical protein
MKTPLYNARERFVLDAPECFILRLHASVGSPRREVRRTIDKDETPASVWHTIVDELANPPFNKFRISVYAVRRRSDGEHHCAISLQHCPWKE